MVIAGFSTRSSGYLIYLAICILTAGIGYLVFRWAPRWRISLVGTPAPLRKCSWVVVEVSPGVLSRRSKRKTKTSQNQWGEFTVHYVSSEEYGYAMSTVFNPPTREKTNGHEYYDDRELILLRYLDYRYMRLLYHPREDKFVLNNDWWDPQWTDIKAMREGLDSEEREPRMQVFGNNMIEIQEKTIPQLLMDEVRRPIAMHRPYTDPYRPSTPSTYSKLPVSYSGPPTSTITMQPLSSSSRCSASLPQSSRLVRR
jgi:cation-transporting P-type ATPase 13A2